jgi:SAM-dependent methyltransferase
MHIETVKHYDEQAERIAAQYEAADLKLLHNLLRRWLPTEGKVLEIGCGSGRDAEYMASVLGLDVTATDASEKMISLASNFQSSKSRHKIVFSQAAFPLPVAHDLLKEQFEAIVSVAVLMHIPDHELFEFAYQVRAMLKNRGIFICSFCSERQSSPDDPRFYVNREPCEIQLLFERIGFNILTKEENTDGMGRNTTWVTLVFGYDAQFGVRPVDQIESIINRDSKTATYKLALLRSLCDIAQTSFHHVKWHSGNRVSIPLGLVVEKWIYYYWPLIDSNLDLPEMRLGIRAKGLAFRPLLTQFIECFRPGGLNAFMALFQSGRLDDRQSILLGQLATQIAQTIIKGPIAYSGGSLEGIGRVFTFEGKQTLRNCYVPSNMIKGFGRVLFSASIWRELCLVGHWIGEAIILRWAELSRSFAKSNVEVSDILAELLIIPETERATGESKNIFSKQKELICVWSGKKLSVRNFAVDHVIPFSIWHNNDLWNLLPADPKVNNQKRDKIVTRETLYSRRDCLIHYWQILYQVAPVRFSNEVGRTLLGDNFQENNWEIPTFSTLSEAVETIARQRGVQRWP